MFRIAALFLAALLSPASAFRIGARSAPSMSVDRKQFVGRFMSGAALAVGAATAGAPVASAAKYGGFGAESPEVVDPKDAVRDEAALGSSEVKSSLDKVRAVQAKVQDAKAALDKDKQADVTPFLRQISYADLRINLYNASNKVLDEDAQRGTDRLIRVIMQDINEAEQAAVLKPGVKRSERKIEALTRKVRKLNDGIEDYLKFFA